MLKIPYQLLAWWIPIILVPFGIISCAEWHNLAYDSQYSDTKEKLRAELLAMTGR